MYLTLICTLQTKGCVVFLIFIVFLSDVEKFLVFAHKTDIRVVSLEAPYAVDVVLPIDDITNAVALDVDTVQRKWIFTSTLFPCVHYFQMACREIKSNLS